MGTSCRLWLRFSAVTTSSSIVLLAAAVVAGAAGEVWARAEVPNAAANSAAPDVRRRTLLRKMISPGGPAGELNERPFRGSHWRSRTRASTLPAAFYNLNSKMRFGGH